MTAGFVTSEALLVATIDAALAAENLAVAAEAEGLGCCFIGSLRNDLERVIEILDLPLLTYPVFGLVLGHPAEEGKRKPRLPQTEILHQNTYQRDPEHIAQRLDDYDRKVLAYYANRQGGKRETTWTDEMRKKFSRPSRENVSAVLRKQGFFQR